MNSARIRVLATSTILCFLVTTIAAASEPDHDAQKVAAADVRTIADAIQRFAVAQNFYPEPRDRVVTVDELEKNLVPSYLAALPLFDPWGRPYHYWTNGEHYLVGSGGPEDAVDRWSDEITTNPRGASAALNALCSSPASAAVLLVDGGFCWLSKDITHGPIGGVLTDLDKQVLAAQEAGTIATAVMSYSIDNNAFPVLTNGVTTVQSLESVLEPVYIRALPLSDPWSHPYLYWSNGTSFIVYSAGSDAEDRSYDKLLAEAEDSDTAIRSLCRGAVDELGADLIFANGEPCQWASGGLED
jgi:hypothetical protein